MTSLAIRGVARAIVVGAGPAGLTAAERLAAAGVSVTVYDRSASAARKFLMAGRGGLNLAHSETMTSLTGRYGSARDRLAPAIESFPAEEIRRWCSDLGVETFVGTSGRIFPRSLKASPLLRAWLRRLEGLGVTFRMRHDWVGFTSKGALAFESPEGPTSDAAPAVVFALGGASWPRLGADGGWTGAFADIGAAIAPFRPSNCGFLVAWTPLFAERFAGTPLKRVGLAFEGRDERGEALVTARGLEGGLVYAFSAALRDAVERDGEARPTLDLRPDIAVDDLARRLAAPRGKRSLSTHLSKAAGLPPVAIGLLREIGPLPADAEALARLVKALPLRMTGTAGLDRAISTAGGVRLDEVDETFMLRRRPGCYVIGEMLDWEAPTGGYLLHACFAMGRLAGEAAARRLAQSDDGGDDDGRLAPTLASTSGGTPS